MLDCDIALACRVDFYQSADAAEPYFATDSGDCIIIESVGGEAVADGIVRKS